MRAFKQLAARVGASALVLFGLLRCSSPYRDDATPDADDGGTLGTDGGSTSGDAAAPPGDGSSTGTLPDGGKLVLAPGEIVCASTATICNINQVECCINLSGTDGPAARTYNSSSATCAPVDGGNCGVFIGIGADFNVKFPQTCAQASDCSDNGVCCAVSSDPATRFGKQLSTIRCAMREECDTRGRTLCTGRADCSATENCLPETDPVLSHLYATFCR